MIYWEHVQGNLLEMAFMACLSWWVECRSNSSGTVEYYHVDHLGSTRLKTNSTGGVIYESNYEPYGPGCG